ncbi:MAG: DUF2085 domain-containing protein [Chloroflexi bacterium]|nr:DUF2085 domain-containing protein [Chloroflexota bacterium]MCI0578346.1 DUF2085 domain-containing protein [Chloroflexota bacterium]MCI0646251.1 DUF2085 domain-containing protein [Chloroflexota bacterium]MCI0732129.1 DUF2085 domain-containing protein [Chloroflexota bacterium]
METKTPPVPERPAARRQPVTGRQRAVVIKIDKFVYWLSRHWLAVLNTVIGIYVALPILAPVFMNAGLTGPGRAIYIMYSPMCHQMAQRSFFLFGEQPAYPRAIAGTELTPIEAYVDDIPQFEGVAPDNWAQFFAAARAFVGNERMGYKMALCERDIGIYSFVFLSGLVYAVLRRRTQIKPMPMLAFIILGMGPIALDGFSQLFGYWTTPLDGSAASGLVATIQSIFPLRESTPLLRTLTGAWFGLALVWLTYPHVAAGMKESQEELGDKLRQIGEIQ